MVKTNHLLGATQQTHAKILYAKSHVLQLLGEYRSNVIPARMQSRMLMLLAWKPHKKIFKRPFPEGKPTE